MCPMLCKHICGKIGSKAHLPIVFVSTIPVITRRYIYVTKRCNGRVNGFYFQAWPKNISFLDKMKSLKQLYCSNLWIKKIFTPKIYKERIPCIEPLRVKTICLGAVLSSNKNFCIEKIESSTNWTKQESRYNRKKMFICH